MKIDRHERHTASCTTGQTKVSEPNACSQTTTATTHYITAHRQTNGRTLSQTRRQKRTEKKRIIMNSYRNNRNNNPQKTCPLQIVITITIVRYAYSYSLLVTVIIIIIIEKKDNIKMLKNHMLRLYIYIWSERMLDLQDSIESETERPMKEEAQCTSPLGNKTNGKYKQM